MSNEPTPGAVLIAAERQRQIDVEGYTTERDTGYTSADLALAAVCYATPSRLRRACPGTSTPGRWPWAGQFWKPTPDDRVRELVKAGALIAAEIDRLQAAAEVSS